MWVGCYFSRLHDLIYTYHHDSQLTGTLASPSHPQWPHKRGPSSTQSLAVTQLQINHHYVYPLSLKKRCSQQLLLSPPQHDFSDSLFPIVSHNIKRRWIFYSERYTCTCLNFFVVVMVLQRRQKGALGSFSLTVHATATKLTAVLGLDKVRLNHYWLRLLRAVKLLWGGHFVVHPPLTNQAACSHIPSLALLLFYTERGFLCTLWIVSFVF